jgi:DNA-binding transcriptional regulator YhcF (GntR family)
MTTTSFNFDRPIYRQIRDQMGERILRGEWPEGERMPAVRELAMQLQVNPNTVMRAYESLQSMEVIESRRGIGYFVAEGAAGRLRRAEREAFVTVGLPEVFERMNMLGVSIDEVKKQYEHFNGK